MKKIAVIIIFLGAGVPVLTMAGPAGRVRPAPSSPVRPATDHYAPGQVLIKYRTSPNLAQFNQQIGAAARTPDEARQVFHARFGIRDAGPVYRHSVAQRESSGFSQWRRIELPPHLGVESAVKALSQSELVEWVEPNYRVHADALSTTYTPNGAFNDTYYIDGHTQWWIHRTRGDAAKAANYVFTGTQDVVVAVLDTGVDLDHPEFTGRLVAGYNAVTLAAQPNDDNTYFGSTPILGHGTHAAGMIAAAANNASGVAGIAWDTHIKIMPVKVLDYEGNGTIADVADGITWAASHSADVINISLGTYDLSQALWDACDNAYNAGICLVGAIGNSGLNLRIDKAYYPACFDVCISVGATNASDLKTQYSNWSDPVGLLDCMAPGGLIDFGGAYNDYGITATANTGGWSAVYGTSFAAPQVSALAALLKLQVPGRTPDDLRGLILSTCDANLDDPEIYRGNGRINIARALGVYQTPTISPTPRPTLTITFTPSITHTFTITPTFTHSPTISPTPSITRTFSRTPTSSPTATHSPTPTASPTHTTTFTITPTCTQTELPTDLSRMLVYPNPWVATKAMGRTQMVFENLPVDAGIRLYTLDGRLVCVLQADVLGRAVWDLANAQNQPVSSGVYLYVVSSRQGEGRKGKLAVIR